MLSWQPPTADVTEDHLQAYHVAYQQDGGPARKVILSPRMRHFSLATEYGRVYRLQVVAVTASGRQGASPLITERAGMSVNVTNSIWLPIAFIIIRIIIKIFRHQTSSFVICNLPLTSSSYIDNQNKLLLFLMSMLLII